MGEGVGGMNEGLGRVGQMVGGTVLGSLGRWVEDSERDLGVASKKF